MLCLVSLILYDDAKFGDAKFGDAIFVGGDHRRMAQGGNFGSFRGGRRSFKGGRNQRSVPNADIRSEIKDPEQIRKQRQLKATRISKLKNNSRGKKFGAKGGSSSRGRGQHKGSSNGGSRGGGQHKGGSRGARKGKGQH